MRSLAILFLLVSCQSEVSSDPGVSSSAVTQDASSVQKLERAKLPGLDGAWMREIKVIPNLKDGAFRGFKLFGISPESTAARLGLSNGDLLLGVNGQEVTSLESAMKAAVSFSSATEGSLLISRRGQEVTLRYSFF